MMVRNIIFYWFLMKGMRDMKIIKNKLHLHNHQWCHLYLYLFFSNGSSSSGNPSSPPKRMGSLDELYEVTTPIDDDVTLYYHLATCDPIMFEEVIKDAK